jgi:hypothetical protein
MERARDLAVVYAARGRAGQANIARADRRDGRLSESYPTHDTCLPYDAALCAVLY